MRRLCRQGRQPTCPLCNRTISLQVRYRLPLPRRLPRDPLDEPADQDELALDAEAGRDLQVVPPSISRVAALSLL